MNIIGYARVSTAEQARSGASIAAQEHAIQQWASSMGYELEEILSDEGESAATIERPALSKALKYVLDAESPCDGLVVVKLDRLARSVYDFCTLVNDFAALDKSLVSIRDGLDMTSASGRLVANVMMSVAQWEREVISERTKDALAQRKREGVRLGRPPSELPTKEQAASIIALRGAGAPLRAISAEVGVSVSTVRRVVARLGNQG